MDTYRENTLSNKIQALTKSMDMEIWAGSTLNQLLRVLPKLTKTGSYSRFQISKNKVVIGET